MSVVIQHYRNETGKSIFTAPLYVYIFLSVPVGLPNVDCLRVGDSMLSCLVVQQVKEVFDSQGDRTAGAKDHCEQVIYKLLQCALKKEEEESSHLTIDFFLLTFPCIYELKLVTCQTHITVNIVPLVKHDVIHSNHGQTPPPR